MALVWSNEDTIFFLEVYQGEPCIWNPKHANHKDKKKVADAWSRLSDLTKKPVKELKNKKEILMTTFRKHFKKVQDSIRSGAGSEDIFKPSWFAYELMESFLTPIYTCNDTSNTETQSQQNIDEVSTEPADGEMNNSLIDDETPKTSRATPASTKKLHRRPVSSAEQQMAEAFGQLTNVLGRRSERPPLPKEDECDLYGKLLAKKLRDQPKQERQLLMYQIDGLFLNRLHSPRHTPSPRSFYSSGTNFNRPPSNYSEPLETINFHRPPSNYSEPLETINFHRPPSTQTSYSEPSGNLQASLKRTISMNPVPSHSKHRKTSSVQPPLPQLQNNDTITFYSAQPNSSNYINILSDQTIVPTSQPNIINEALLKAFEDIEREES